MAKRFVKLTVDRVDVVDRGANYDPETNDGSHILIMKRDTMPETQTNKSGAAAFFADVLKRLGLHDPDLIAKASEFDAALLSRRSGVILDDVYDRVGALTSVLSSAVYSENPRAVMMRAVKDFSRSIDTALAEWFDETATEKAVELTGERRQRFEQLAKAVAARLDGASDDEGTGAERAAKGATTMPNENKEQNTGLSAEAIAKAVSDAMAASLPAALAAATAPITATLDSVTKRLEASEQRTADAEAVAKAEREKREDAEGCTVAKSFRSLPLTATPDKDGGFFKRAKNALTGDDYKRFTEILKAADEMVRTGRMFDSIGSADAADASVVGKSAQDEINERAEALMKADLTMKRSDAIAAVLKQDPVLGKRNRDEHTRRQRQAGATDLNDRE